MQKEQEDKVEMMRFNATADTRSHNVSFRQLAFGLDFVQSQTTCRAHEQCGQHSCF